MRAAAMLIGVTMVAACDAKGPVLLDEANAGAGNTAKGSTSVIPGTGTTGFGTGGGVSRSSGSTVGNGGSALGSGGAALGSGGSAVSTGGTVQGSGGSALSAGGAVQGSGGAKLSAGGTTLASGGTDLGSGGSALGTGGVVFGSGGTVSGSGGSALGTGGTSLGTGGSKVGTGGNLGTSANTSGACAAFATQSDCQKAGCMAIMGRKQGATTSEFIECRTSGACAAVMTAARPPGQPDVCYEFGGCVPTGWTDLGSSTCPGSSGVIPTVTGFGLYLNCMPVVRPDALAGTFTVFYQNTGSTAQRVSVKSATVVFNNNPAQTWTFAVTPADSGLIAARSSATITHTKVADSGSGTMPMCQCTSGDYVKLTVNFESQGDTMSGSYAATLLNCVY